MRGLRWVFFLLAVVGLQAKAAPLKTLVVMAHPDDEYYVATTMYRLKQEKKAIIDVYCLTRGEMGFRYSKAAESVYRKTLADERSAKKELPAIRARELEQSSSILGVRRVYWGKQTDFGYTKDVNETLKRWKSEQEVQELKKLIQRERYDSVFALLPVPGVHGHHQAATIIALRAVKEMPENERPMILGAYTSSHQPRDEEHRAEIRDAKNFVELPGFPETKVTSEEAALQIDRNAKLPQQPQLTYQVIVNWMIAAHKSQGLFQTFVGRDDIEVMKMFAISKRANLINEFR